VIRLNDSIIITGTSQGIGKEIANQWQNKIKIVHKISKTRGTDVTNFNNIKDEIYNMFEYDKPIALINNAGVIELGNILELSTESWKKQFDVNINGMFNCSKVYIKLCIKNKVKGKIINICSTAGLGARPGYSAYAASKSAAINFSLSLSKELKQYGIKVYCVCPGAVNTDMRHYINPDDDFENMMKPYDVANFVIDLIEDGEYLDGQILTIKK
jgi:3-oxoacyl-[acyl-carrier protein] reductase